MPNIVQQLIRRCETHLPYPLALQSLLSLVLLATLPSALAESGGRLSPRFALLCVAVGVNLAACWTVPVRKLRRWQQIGYLALQMGVALAAHALMPTHPLGYMYLTIVLQAVYLLRPLLSIAFAGGVYAIWSGSLMIASASLIEWARGNLILVFPALCMLIAATVYARQHERYEQVQHVLQQMQRHYDSLVLRMHDAPERAVREERDRLAQTIAADIAADLAQTEQNIASAISQGQANLAWLAGAVEQLRGGAAATVDRMRAAVSSLRSGTREEPSAIPAMLALPLPPDELMTVRQQRTWSWSLPLAFVAIALPLALLQHSLTPVLALAFALCCAALIGGYAFTQRIRAPLLVLVGLFGQALAVLGMVFVTHALPLTLGLMLVMWQTATRLPIGQIVTFLIGVQTLIGVVLVRVLVVPSVDGSQLLIFSVAFFVVTGLVATARRELGRRRQAAAKLARLTQLTGELEQQLDQARILAAAVERHRLAREIHDDLGHRLVLLNLNLQLVEDLIAEDPGAALDQLALTGEQLRAAWSSVLDAADATLAIDGEKLLLAIDRLVYHCQTLTTMHIEPRVIGDFDDVAPALACAIYRAVQEGLTNACKYAQAQHIHVLVYRDDVEIRVSVRDDGCDGVSDPQHQTCFGAPGHFGLAGLRERAELLDGTVEAGPLAEGGFGLTMAIPLP